MVSAALLLRAQLESFMLLGTVCAFDLCWGSTGVKLECNLVLVWTRILRNVCNSLHPICIFSDYACVESLDAHLKICC